MKKIYLAVAVAVVTASFGVMLTSPAAAVPTTPSPSSDICTKNYWNKDECPNPGTNCKWEWNSQKDRWEKKCTSPSASPSQSKSSSPSASPSPASSTSPSPSVTASPSASTSISNSPTTSSSISPSSSSSSTSPTTGVSISPASAMLPQTGDNTTLSIALVGLGLTLLGVFGVGFAWYTRQRRREQLGL